MARLAEKVTVITGGAGGIGSAAGKLFAQEGANVVLVDLDESALKQAVAFSESKNVSYVVADVTQPKEVEHYVQTTVARHGGIDVFLNNAGIEGEVNVIPDYDIDTFDKVMAVNVRGVWLGLKYVIPEMQKRGSGSIVITSSIAGVRGYANLSAYNASKHAVVGLMRTAALECAPLGIRVNTVNPAPIDTRMIRSLEEQISSDSPEQIRAGFEEGIPLKRYGTAEEVAHTMLFLASDESSYSTGSEFIIDGGLNAI